MITSRILRAAAGVAALAAAGLAQAHPGHGMAAADSLMHVLEAEHVVPMLLALGVGYAVVVLRAIRRRGKDRQTKQDR